MAYDAPYWRDQLSLIEQKALLRKRFDVHSRSGVELVTNGEKLTNFASNDYLGLASHPEIVEALCTSARTYGVGSGASDVVSGHFQAHSDLEQKLARFTKRDKALLFSTGYMANLAVASAFANSRALLLQDKLNHASLIDGAKLSGARAQRYLHNNPASLGNYLAKLYDADKYDHCLVLSDGVFSMDGNVADISQLSEVCSSYTSLLAIDDAHGLGVLGEGGCGSVLSQGVSQEQCPLLIGTFGKAFGTFGAFVAGPEDLISYLEQVARPHIYTTALPPSLVDATSKSLSLIEAGDDLRTLLNQRITQFKEELSDSGVTLLDSQTAIQGVVLGDNQLALDAGAFLRARGFLVGVIRPPTVPQGSARLRITMSAAHNASDLSNLTQALKEFRRERMEA
ncbi:8-amino-7-oxononanoate synthase [Oleiphilus sp. HI0125]|uniref:8-amino-7-oxononanoate synthase n=2 Tax=Oleiphilus sp. HI0125 TaxID=1822266 RepID=UPI000837E0C3|nr:8-amino-7-oxononanoate synthase [Oleiphilus sp. HI0125]